ncbi:MAG TPA: thioredoxin domain-containing protein [Stellaceae bacterium]
MSLDENALGGETSPYLLQHKDNPVHWQPWGEPALTAARAQNKPILLSIGYAACHWCHVMAHECFERPEIAAQMNADFVNIKVDREERPDLDTIYMNALAALGEQGGWPLTMFLTPAGEPFWGGTYFPPEPRYGRPSLPQVLTAMARAFRDDQAAIVKNVGVLREALDRLGAPQGGDDLSMALTDQAAARLAGGIDSVNGGFGDAPKFPQVPALETVWRGWKRGHEQAMRDATILTLDHICQGGIYDHLGGGFARYATDARWLAPHFEKMLYDNALLIDLLTGVWQETRSALYAERIAETIGWLVREMRQREGGFSSSLDADSEHEEGKFYVWDEAAIDAVLGDRAARFKQFYDVSAGGNWEGKTILNRLRRLARADDTTERELTEDRAVLFAARAPRVRPGLDDKVLADWNGLAIAALANAGRVFGRADWLALARGAFDFVRRDMSAGDDRLWHSWRAGQARNRALIDDYANMARAALALHEATGEAGDLAQAEAWVAVAQRYYWDDAKGGYFFTASDAEALIARTKQAQDAPNPSGNGMMAGVLARLYFLTGDETYRLRAEILVRAFAGDGRRGAFGHGALLNGNELLQRGLQVVIRGRRSEPATEALLAAVNAVSLPNLVLNVVAPERALPAEHPAAGKGQVGGTATAYVCEGPVCSLPLTDAAALRSMLAEK